MATENEATVDPRDIAAGDGAVAVQGSSAVDSVRHNVPSGITGAVGVEDIQFPRLKVAYGVGKLAERFHPGDLVLGDEHLLTSKGGSPLVFVAAGVFVFWKEYQTREMWDAGIKPRVFATKEEVIANGGTIDWIGDQAPDFSKAAEMRILIEKPKDLVCGLFSTEIEGKEYAPARWAVDKNTYKTAAMPVVTASVGALRRRGLLAGRFEIVTEMRKSKKNPANMSPIAVVRLTGYNSDAFIQAATALLSAPVATNLDAIDLD
jgi:hypothetical protein